VVLKIGDNKCLTHVSLHSKRLDGHYQVTKVTMMIKLWSQWSNNEHMNICRMLDVGCEYQFDVNLKVY
jgi:hypothetical protein